MATLVQPGKAECREVGPTYPLSQQSTAALGWVSCLHLVCCHLAGLWAVLSVPSVLPHTVPWQSCLVEVS